MRVPLALDAGPPASAVLPTYDRLSPADGRDESRGYGWTGGAPQSRDRGGPDDLRRDIVTDTAPRPLPADTFQWLRFTVDGGAAGRAVGLDFAADQPGAFWRFAGLVVT